MASNEFELRNSVYWDRNRDGNKVYLRRLKIAVESLPFVSRQVHLRFINGPALDLSVFDMDRLVHEFERLRSDLFSADTTNSDLGTIVIPGTRDQTGQSKKRPRKRPNKAKTGQRKKKCARCCQRVEVSGDWYGDLCPRCADNTDGEWICRV